MRGSETPAAGGADDGVTRRIHALLDPAQTPGLASRFLAESSLLLTPFGQGEKPCRTRMKNTFNRALTKTRKSCL
eukprot:scaffold74699_cov57-Phaeocystis_antarctica.AAC.2